MNKYEDINWIKSNHRLIQFFGLGFIQVKLNDVERLHFYHQSLPPFVEHPHNHRYDFTSTVLKGSLRNIIWKQCSPHEGEACVLRYDACTSDKTIVTPVGCETNRKLVATFKTEKGSSYFLPKELFHQVKVETFPTITLLCRGPKEYEFASILEPGNFEPICPFSKKLPENELWEIVKDCLQSGGNNA